MNEEYVCNCCLVTREEIEDAVKMENVTTVQQLKEITMATSGCGKCELMCEHYIAKAVSAQADSVER